MGRRRERDTLRSQGNVWKARDRLPDDTVALKWKCFDNFAADEGIPSTAIHEISILRELAHVNVVVELKNCFRPENRASGINLVFEWVDCDLKKYLDSHDRFLSSQLVKLFFINVAVE